MSVTGRRYAVPGPFRSHGIVRYIRRYISNDAKAQTQRQIDPLAADSTHK
jgi:hypothetical protein